MSDKVFLDTNILIYLYSQDEPIKQDIVIKLLEKTQAVFVSTQVLNEIAYVLHKKKKLHFKKIESIFDEILKTCFLKVVDEQVIRRALLIAPKYRFSYFDSLMIAAACESDCKILYSEDLHHGQKLEKILTIINPFE